MQTLPLKTLTLTQSISYFGPKQESMDPSVTNSWKGLAVVAVPGWLGAAWLKKTTSPVSYNFL